jgi:hypothetical protein
MGAEPNQTTAIKLCTLKIIQYSLLHGLNCNAESFTNPNSRFVTYAANIFRRSWREFLLLVVRVTPGLSRLFARFKLNLFKPTETRFFRD